MSRSVGIAPALVRNFLGNSPAWYKLTIVAFLIVNPLALLAAGGQGATVAGWLVLLEFIFTLAMALKCYPLLPGGLIAIEAVLIGLTSADSVYRETLSAVPVILLLAFMVTGIFFLKDLLTYVFTRILLGVRSQLALALIFCFTSAVLSGFLDALTVLAVIVTVGSGFYQVFHRVASGKPNDGQHDVATDAAVADLHRSDLNAFRGFLRGLVMHAAIGSALGGVATQVGEPQNLLIAKHAGWNFSEFFLHMLPVSASTLLAGLVICAVIDKFKLFGYGTALPVAVRRVLEESARVARDERTARDRAVLVIQGLAALVLITALALHLAEVGIIGLLIIVLVTAFTGVTDEHRLGVAFAAAMPFTALLVVFFAIVAVLHDQHLFEPIVQAVLASDAKSQAAWLYAANGLLSAISDNVFVATIYITEIKAALLEGTISQQQFETLAIAINAGTNIPSIATPNGQAAFLFLLTSALAPLIRLSYGRMVWMALPYTVVLSIVGLVGVMVFAQ